MHLGMIIAILK